MEGKKISFGSKKTKKVERPFTPVITEDRKYCIECVEIKEEPIKEEEEIEANEALEQMAVRELMQEARKDVKLEVPDNLAIPAPAKPVMTGEKESTLDDYESVPIQQFGMAKLRGMGWTPSKEGMASQASTSRSRSVSPDPSERGPHRESAARRALILGLADPHRDPELSPPPRHVHALPVVPTQGGSLRALQGEAVPIEQTPGGRDRRVQPKLAMPLCSEVVERVEALDMSDEEAEEIMKKDPWHVRRWMHHLPRPSTGTVTNPEVEVRPSTSAEFEARPLTLADVQVRPSSSEMMTLPGREPRRAVGSDLDSEFDYEATAGAGARKSFPDTEELDEPMQAIINTIDKGMDDAADCLLGTSPSFTWLSDFESFRGVREVFSGPTPGPLKDYDSPYDAFIDIWDKDIIDLIVRETNRYAQQTIESLRNSGSLTGLSRLHSWTDTNADEMMLLFAVFMYMALDPRTSVTEYWSKDEILCLPGFKRLMTYDRYILLSKFLHFVDNTADASQQLTQNGDGSSARLSPKLVNLSPIIEHLGKKFKYLYNLGPDISIDESLTLFKGRLSWVQTIRSRSARFGIKSYELCESSTGYMAGFQIYTGKFDGSSGDNSLGVNLGEKSTKAVLDLLQGLEHRGHCVVMDNFYNCPSLARYLKSWGFDCLGTLRVCRRNVPSDIAKVPGKVSKGTIISRHCGDVSIIAWMDSKMLNIISTYHKPDTYIGTKAGKSLVKPLCVRDYNTSMGGVDLKDQKLSMYLLERKRGVKWYIKMYKRLLNVSIHNALVMYQNSLNRRDKLPVTHREFRYQLAEALYKRHRPCLVQEVSQPDSGLIRLRRDIVHEPEFSRGQALRKRCTICYRKEINKMVHSKCTQCDVFLCFKDCWRIWHSSAKLPGQEKRGRKRRRADE